MPRKARIDAPGALHHIIIRGIERKAIFKDDSDRENFLERLSALLSESKTGCYGWALMTNHVHMIFKTGLSPVATVMRRLLTGYAVSFNRRHRRHGQLFQNRYKSFLCEEEVYLKELVRYIHLNPLRVEAVLKKANEDLQQKYRLTATGPKLDELLRKVAWYYRIDPDDLKTASKESTLTKARTVLCYLAVRRLMISCADVARHFKNQSCHSNSSRQSWGELTRFKADTK
jgi:REP element-mobilizing transposase RayT